MNKSQALDAFWNSFGVPAYSEETVPDDVAARHITYSVATGSVNSPVALSASIWDTNTTSWDYVSNLAENISNALIEVKSVPLDVGYMYITRGTPFAQRMTDENDSVRRIYINIMVEFLTP